MTHPTVTACTSCGAKNRVPAAATGTARCAKCKAPLAWVVEADDADFDDVAASSSINVLVDLWAPWCGPCRMVGPILDEIQSENGDKITVLKLNVDENPNLAMQYQITSIPAMKVFNKGQVEKTIIGAKPKFALEQDLAAYLA